MDKWSNNLFLEIQIIINFDVHVHKYMLLVRTVLRAYLYSQNSVDNDCGFLSSFSSLLTDKFGTKMKTVLTNSLTRIFN